MPPKRAGNIKSAKTADVKKVEMSETTPSKSKRQPEAIKAPVESRKRKAVDSQTASTTKRVKPAALNTAPSQRLDVFVFGDGSSGGELGLGSAKNAREVKRPRLNPHLPAATVGVVHASVGGMHTAVLTHDNKILTWGVNDQAALGRDTTWDGGLKDMDNPGDSDDDSDDEGDLNPKESTPGEMDTTDVPNGTIFTQLCCSDSCTYALTSAGLVYGCGTFRNNEGIFGFTEHTLVQRTLTLVPYLKDITKLAAGVNHILALDKTGRVYAWGTGQQNQLGRRILERRPKNSLVPTSCGLKKIKNIGCGSYHSFAVDDSGKLWGWGENSNGQTGSNQNVGVEGAASAHMPEVITGVGDFSEIVQIAGGEKHTIACTQGGEVLVWGRADGGQLGIDFATVPTDDYLSAHGRPSMLTKPRQVPGIEGHAVAAGSDHCIVVARDGKAYSWGFSVNYQTGLGTEDQVDIAQHIDNTATRGKHLIWAGAGGQFSVLTGIAG